MKKAVSNILTLILVAAALFVFLNRKEPVPETLIHDQMPSVQQQAPADSLGPSLLTPQTIHRIEQTKYLEESLAFQGIIPLETSEESTFGEITDLIFMDDKIFIADRLTTGVYQFNDDGTFVNTLGTLGQGPGEYESVRHLQACYDGLVGVADPLMGRVHLFHPSGEFIRASPTVYGGKTFMVGRGFAWPKEDRIIVCSFNTAHVQAPLHAILDPGQIQGVEGPREPAIINGFGKRFESIQLARAKGSGVKAHTAFQWVDGKIWSGSPYTTYLSIYDKDGQLLAQPGRKISRDHELFITEDDLVDVHRKADPDKYMREVLVTKFANLKIMPLDDLMLVQVGSLIDIYDRNANLIAPNRRLQHRGMRMFTDGKQRFVRAYSPGMPTEDLDEEIIEQLKPYAPEEGDHNPVLIVYTLKKPHTSS